MGLKDLIVTLAALISMPLSIYNFWHARYIEKVRLKVIPQASSY